MAGDRSRRADFKDLGVNSIRLLTSSRRITYVGISGFGIEIVGTEPVEG